jgi:2-octaprenyl-6-methoxyphenol hydroxylase
VEISYQVDEQDQALQARLVVGADGARSRIRAAVGIETEQYDYRQTAIICNVTPEQPHRGRAFESFTPTGPFALLPHRDGRCGLVWSVASDQANELMALADGEFLQLAEQRFGPALGPWKKIGRRSSYPLQLVRATSDWRPRVLILGNAAHAIHPIAAQGFNLGLRDVAVLAEVLANAHVDFHAKTHANTQVGEERQATAEFDPGITRLLQAYSAWRKDDQAETIAYTDGLARLYANPGTSASVVRRAGLLAHRLLPTLRRRLAIKAMGFRGRIPKLALGERLGGV